ncbi:peptide ABC transporter permease [Streptomyces agglomeratus]|uniref:Peptide ABC transporter permease n=1 Tax=Streptomyces agglomeratus TaxID=285458 RepID=A0A1E5P6K1_9ACTN|nr:ABC transporter permease [Streptomyces agglomeratus]OEJ25188.1 peptide ABC transporter permease [Streptomyces agglomeratus]OEJ40783.1 peptide ABC transporter permease [Streptomyces agglomeratus]OEJ44836.1 peptide ABC transporter permease [Streptomyces agglomeratus]OEJ53324.1 peptide ABC transporter permease [Streptomyces agglomeratus]OEJ60661.1 peptide ABC transporter permease [Streptomyces agglomeratus]
MPDKTALSAAEVPVPAAPPIATEAGPGPGKPRSLWSDAWHELRRNPLFLVSMVLIVILGAMAIFPSLFTSASPRDADLAKHYLQHPNWGNFFAPDWFGYDAQGRSIYARVIYGARASITVGIVVTVLVTFFGGLIGMLAGYFGGWLDSVLSRLTDVFFGIPFIVGAMVILTSFEERSVWVVILALAFLGWTQIARVARGSVITIKQADYVVAAKALGASTWRILIRHILPNAIAPVIVVATIALGGYIAAEATLSFLGIGLAPPTVSWGIDVSSAKDQLRNAPYVLMIPSVMVSLTVLSFLMFGDAVRNALDPKMR